MNTVQGFSDNTVMSDGTANNFVTNEISLMLKSHVNTLINKHITHIATLININLDNIFFSRKKLLSLSNILTCNGLIINKGSLSFSNKESISSRITFHLNVRNERHYQLM